jgi:gamma-glutamyltranspeptidase / glutathione hydrolase
MNGVTRRTLLALLASLALVAPLAAQRAALPDGTPASGAPIEAVRARHGMVVAQESRAARIGVEILEKGGNAVDAAVATGFALAVTYPRAGNIGGGGYMVIHLAAGNFDTTIDYRETAPAAVTRETFLDENGNADPRKSRESALAIGVPGTVAGLALAHARYGSGKFTLADLIAPAIALARDGFPIENDLDSLSWMQGWLGRWPASAKIFLKADGSALRAGDMLVQRDLAGTLAAIARDGPRAFYAGETAERLAAAVQAAGGVMTREDLARYQPVERPPMVGSYRGHRIVSMPPSSSGGVALIEMLNILEGYPLGELEPADRLHLMVEAMKRAYFDRAKFLGDPASVTFPDYLTTKDFAADVRARIDPQHAAPAESFGSITAPAREGDNTTHFSVVDASGNAVSNTYTLNFNYGVGMVAAGTGILLNNELDDFAAKPGAPNFFGLVGSDANAPGPGKRPLSSMTPTIVFEGDKPLLVVGSPGGSRIITTVLQIIVNVIDRKLPLADAVAAPRIHHQWSPDEVWVERGLSPDLIRALQARGDRVVQGPPRTSANSILVTDDGLIGAADNRTRGALAAGY